MANITETKFTVGYVTVEKSVQPKRGHVVWLLRYKDIATGLTVRRRLRELKRKQVVAICEQLNAENLAGRGYLARKPSCLTVEAALTETITVSRMNERSRKMAAWQAIKFIEWLAETYPQVSLWSDLRPAMLEMHVKHLEEQGKAWDTIRHRATLIKTAWRRMSENYPDEVRPLPKLRMPPKPRREITCLAPGEVAALLDWLKKYDREVWPIAALQALAGLRMYEASCLRVQDINFDEATITITESQWHVPKTQTSFRTIPVCKELLEALRVAVREQKVCSAGGEVFTTKTGTSYDGPAISQRMRRAIKIAAATPTVIMRKHDRPMPINQDGLGNPRLSAIPARKLRAAFVTMASRLDASDRLLRAYIGHSANDMIGLHYRRIEVDELRSIAAKMNDWRSLIPKACKNGAKIQDAPSVNAVFSTVFG